jgi:hypothetical protein
MAADPAVFRKRRRLNGRRRASYPDCCGITYPNITSCAELERFIPLPVHEYVAPYKFAVIYAGLGDKDAAFVWLSRASQERSYLLTYLTVDERLDNLIPIRALTTYGVGSDSLERY